MLEKWVFQGDNCKICIPVKFEFWENWLRGLIELIEYIKETSILCYYTIQVAYAVPEKLVFSRAGYQIYVLAKFGCEKTDFAGS